MSLDVIRSSAPGRICLFGEHQDYLGLPVIAMAVDLRFHIRFEPTEEAHFTVLTPDLSEESAVLSPEQSAPRFSDDFLWGALQVLREQGFSFPRRGRLVLTSEIPVRAGCSSSSAMTAAFMRLLLEIGEGPARATLLRDPERVAHLTYRAEKVLFGGAGGMMDQYSCYLGGLIHVFPDGDGYGVESLPDPGPGFVLIDSGVPKDTQGVLRTVGDRARQAVSEARSVDASFDLAATSLEEFRARWEQGGLRLSPESARIVLDHLLNRDLCIEGLSLLRGGLEPGAHARLGALLLEEHRILSETLGISTPRIDELVRLSRTAGALGGKINGSGGGGTAFCFAPAREAAVMDALGAKHARTFPVGCAEGARIDRA